MSNIKTFLKVMSKMGYPNSSVNSIANSINYELDNFLPDLVEEVGEIKADEFVERTLNKLSEDGKGIRVPLSNDKYIYLQIHQSRIDLEETEDAVLIDWSWGDSRLGALDEDGNEYEATLEEIYDNMDMGDWGDYDEMIDNIKDSCYDFIQENCGFGIWFDRHI
jgi:hypothetical protein